MKHFLLFSVFVSCLSWTCLSAAYMLNRVVCFRLHTLRMVRLGGRASASASASGVQPWQLPSDATQPLDYGVGRLLKLPPPLHSPPHHSPPHHSPSQGVPTALIQTDRSNHSNKALPDPQNHEGATRRRSAPAESR